MDTLFGEIVEPYSRSFVTDGEEYSIENRYIIEAEKETSCDETTYEYLFLAYGKVLVEFSAAFLIHNDAQIVEKYYVVPKLSESEKSSEKVSFTTYKLTGNTLLVVSEKLPNVYFVQCFIKKLIPWIERTNNTVVLTSENMANFKPREYLSPFIRSLKTSTCTITSIVPNLELPNTISDLPAAVISWCEANKKNAVVYTIYLESSYMDSITAEPLLQLLKMSNFNLKLSPLNTSVFQSIANVAQSQHSNLYL